MKIKLDNKPGIIYNWVVEGLEESDKPASYEQDFTAGIYDNDNKLMAGIIFHHHNKECVYLTVRAVSPRWFTRDFDKWLYRFIFEDLGYKKIGCHSSSRNQKSRRFLDKYGFCLEGVERYSRVDGSHTFIYGITKEEFKQKRLNKYVKKTRCPRSAKSTSTNGSSN